MHSLQSAIAEAFKYHREGNLAVAESLYDQILCQIDKPDANVMFGYGSILIARQAYGLGISLLQTGLKIYDKHPLAWTNLGVAYKHIGRDDLSLEAYEKALALAPDMPEVLAGLSGFWINKGEPHKAEDYGRRALAVAPDLPAARMNLGIALLEQGRFEEAWPHYEGRWESLDRSMDKRPYKAPRWNGEYVKTLSIHGEQGLGDEILFMSLFPKARERVGRIIIECADRLVSTFQESFGVPCYPNHKTLIEAEGEPDAYIPMASLPLLLGLPDGKPFLRRAHFVNTTGKKIIGVAWKGGTQKTNYRDRSISLDDMTPILNAIDAEFVSVQYGPDEIDIEARKYGLTTGPRDFNSLQRRIAMCDMVVSVCQTAVHQAGSMGVPCVVLVPHKAAWRYCGKSMCWYNSVEFVRQSPGEEWANVIARASTMFSQRYADAA